MNIKGAFYLYQVWKEEEERWWTCQSTGSGMCTKPQLDLEDMECEAIFNMIIEACNDRNFTIQSLILDDDTIAK